MTVLICNAILGVNTKEGSLHFQINNYSAICSGFKYRIA